MRYVLLVAAVLFLLGTAASYVGVDSDDVALAKEVLGIVMALGVIYWFARRGDSTAA